MLARVRHIYETLEANPGYALMRSVARFQPVRRVVAKARGLAQRNAFQTYIEKCRARKSETIFPDIDPVRFADELNAKGVAFGLKLPPEMVEEIRRFADASLCYADRDKDKGFRLVDRAAVEQKLGKPLLLAQYYNTTRDCAVVARLMEDPVLKEVAARYLGSVPTFVGANLWWTFAVKASETDRERHAHLFHRDIDDFRFFKFFFYLTDVGVGDGGHVCVVTSHQNPPEIKPGDHWKIRRFSDEEISGYYGDDKIVEISGKAGEGFAEDTLCIHKGRTPEKEPRLLLQLQFALFDYGMAHDRADPAVLKAA